MGYVYVCVYIYSGSDAEYGVVVSERLGRTNAKEQYAFLFRYNTRRDLVVLTVINDLFSNGDPELWTLLI